MQRILARRLLDFSMEDLWSVLTGEFILIFDDGEIQTNWKETIYSVYSWDFHRMFPATPLLLQHHVSSVLGDDRLGSDTHLQLLGNVMWSVYDEYVPSGKFKVTNLSEVQFRDKLAEKVYRITNQMYNELSYRLEEWVVSLDITDFIEVVNHPAIKRANDTVVATQKSIDETYAIVKKTLLDGTSLPDNPISLAARSKLVNINQVLQCVSARGFLTDTDSHLFYKPVLRGYVHGMRSFHDSLIESRSAAKSLIFSKTPLQQAEYFSRRLQLMSQVVKNLHYGDCGTDRYTLWPVRGAKTENGELKRPGDLKMLVGKKYIDDNGNLRTIKGSDKHLIGTTIKMRTAIHCAHPDPYGICSTCFGELSLSVPEGTNIGQMCCTSLAQKSSQNVLSVKHLDGSSVVDGIILEREDRKYVKVAADDNSYMLADELKGAQVKLIIRADNAANITDVMDAKEVTELNITRVSELADIGLQVTHKGVVHEPVVINVSLGRRLASMTYEMLTHIRKHGWTIDDRNGNYIFDMTDWEWDKPFLTLPLKHFNMSDHSRDIASMLESSVDKLQERDQNKASPDAALIELFDLVNDKLTVNVAVLDVVLYGSMVVSIEKGDYSLPKPWTPAGLGVMKLSMAYRSLASAMAYEGHRDIITDPLSYVSTNRIGHPMDGVLMPAEVIMPKRVEYNFT